MKREMPSSTSLLADNFQDEWMTRKSRKQCAVKFHFSLVNRLGVTVALYRQSVVNLHYFLFSFIRYSRGTDGFFAVSRISLVSIRLGFLLVL